MIMMVDTPKTFPYTQPPADLWDWYDEYLEDPEELDVKAGGGQIMTMGNILKNFLCKLEWFSTLFPRIPVPIQQKLEKKMNERFPPFAATRKPIQSGSRHIPDSEAHFGEAEKASRIRSGGVSERRYSKERETEKRGYSPEKRSYSRDIDYSREQERGHSRDKEGSYSRDWKKDRERDRSDGKYKSRDRDWDYNRDRERDGKGSKDRRHSRSRSREKHNRHSRSRSRDKYSRHSSRDGDRSRSSKDRHNKHRY